MSVNLLDQLTSIVGKQLIKSSKYKKTREIYKEIFWAKGNNRSEKEKFIRLLSCIQTITSMMLK